MANVVRGQHYYDLYINDLHMRTIHLPSRHHRRMQSVLDAMHVEQRKQLPLQSHEPLLVEFSFSHANGKISIKLHEQKGVQYAVQFSPNLARVLGVDNGLKYRQNMTAKRRVSLSDDGNVNSVYVYCDILEHVAVGDTKAPLLCIIDKPAVSQGNVHQTLNPILHVPLQKKNFDTVEINMMTETGVPVPFRSSKALVVLQFRRAIHAYFGL